MDTDLLKIVVGGTIGSIILLWALIFGVTFINAWTFKGQKYDVTVTVQATEKSTRFGDHTNVWCLVYGNQDITYTFFEHLDFEIGKIYHIKFTNQIKGTPFGYEVWGKVTEMEFEG